MFCFTIYDVCHHIEYQLFSRGTFLDFFFSCSQYFSLILATNYKKINKFDFKPSNNQIISIKIMTDTYFCTVHCFIVLIYRSCRVLDDFVVVVYSSLIEQNQTEWHQNRAPFCKKIKIKMGKTEQYVILMSFCFLFFFYD